MDGNHPYEFSDKDFVMRVFYAQAVYDQDEINAVTDILQNSSTELMGGGRVLEFESRIAALFGKRFGLMVNSGSSANMLAMAALDLPRGTEVITPALTFSTTVAPLLQLGLIPAFVDVEPDTYVIDVKRIEEMITPNTKAMMIPNLIGNLADWGPLRELADRHELALIEDSCDTIGYLYQGQPTGQISDIVTTSFYASHVMTAGGFGGMVCFDDEDLFRRATLLRGWGRGSSLSQESETIEDRFNVEVDGIPYDTKFVFEDVGYNYLPSALAAAFGLVQLDKLEKFIQTRIENFEKLRAYFEKYKNWFILPQQTNDTVTAWLALPLIVRDDAPFSRRDLQIYLEENGIQTRTVFTGNILRQPGFKDIERKESPSGYPNADQVMRGGILLGCHQGMGSEQIEYMCDHFESFSAKYRQNA
jgi:CDP-6-deoxy-D-xylo-4-hexulose-3-dehydrase